MKNFREKILYAAVFLMAAASPLFASSLPGVLGEWRLVSEHVTNLTAAEELGKWTSAVYARAAPPGRVEVQVTEGAGPGGLFVPEGEVSSDGGSIGPSAYETLSVAGRRAVLESDSLLGYALAVELGGRSVTLETRGLSREELLAFTENMIGVLVR